MTDETPTVRNPAYYVLLYEGVTHLHKFSPFQRFEPKSLCGRAESTEADFEERKLQALEDARGDTPPNMCAECWVRAFWEGHKNRA